MEGNAGQIGVTVVADSAGGTDFPRPMTLAPADILGVHDLASGDLAPAPEGRTRIVLVETITGRTPWVFSDADEDAPPPHREVVVTEDARVVNLILGWARWHPKTFTEDDVKKWDAWLKAGCPLDHAVVAPDRASFRKKAETSVTVDLEK